MIRWVVYEVELPPPSEHACGPDCMCFQRSQSEESVEVNALSEEPRLEIVRRKTR